MLLIFHFQRVLTKHCCSVGAKQRALGSLLTSWVHGNSPVLTLSRGWDGMWCPHSSPTQGPKAPNPGGGWDVLPRIPGCYRVHPTFKLHMVSWPPSSLPSTNSAADTEVPCKAVTFLFSSTKTTAPLKIICLMLTLLQAYANLLWQCIHKPLHIEPLYGTAVPQSMSWRTKIKWIPCNRHRNPLFCMERQRCWKLQTLDLWGAAEISTQGNQPGFIPHCLKKQTQSSGILAN